MRGDVLSNVRMVTREAARDANLDIVLYAWRTVQESIERRAAADGRVLVPHDEWAQEVRYLRYVTPADWWDKIDGHRLKAVDPARSDWDVLEVRLEAAEA